MPAQISAPQLCVPMPSPHPHPVRAARPVRRVRQPTPVVVRTLTGQRFPLLAPLPEDIEPQVIAEALAKLPAHGGHTPNAHYSLAQHATLLGRLLPVRIAVFGLLAPAPSAYLGEIAAPVRDALARLDAGIPAALDTLRTSVAAAIHGRFNLPYPLPASIAAQLAEAEQQAALIEARDVLPPARTAEPRPSEVRPAPAAQRVRPTSWGHAMEVWLNDLSRARAQWIAAGSDAVRPVQ